MLVRDLKIAGTYWVEDGAAQMGAALAYYMLFSLAPLLFFALTLVGLIDGREGAREHLVARVRDFIDADSASFVRDVMDHARRPPANFGPAVVCIITLVYGALGVFTHVSTSLHRMWRLVPPPDKSIVHRVLKSYLLAFLMVLITCIFILMLLSTTTIMTLVLAQMDDGTPTHGWKWRLGNFLSATVLVAILFIFTFRFMSDGRVGYQHLWRGAVIASLLFTCGKMIIGAYLAYVKLGSAYGAAGSLVVFLSWVYYSSMIFFFGAELVRVRLERLALATSPRP